MNSSEMIEMLKNKNQKAISTLYDQYAPPLYGLILRTLKSPSKAEQVLEQTFFKIIDEIETYKKTTSFFTWMCCIARNLTALKLAENGGEIKNQIGSDDIPLSETQSIEKNCLNLVEGMQEEGKEILNHLYFHGYSLNKTSEVLNMPLDKTKIQLKLAFNHIHNKLTSVKNDFSVS